MPNSYLLSRKSAVGKALHGVALLPAVAAGVSVLLGLGVLIGWQLGVEPLKRILPQFVPMNPATALAFILMGGSLGIRSFAERASPRMLAVARVLPVIVIVIGATRLTAYFGGPDFRFDQLLYSGKLEAGGVPSATGAAALPNRMAPNTALLFILVGAALVGLGDKRPAVRRGARVLALVGALIAIVAAIGYVNGVTGLYRPTALIPIALHTALGFLVITLGMVTLGLRAFLQRHSGAAPDTGASPILLQAMINAGFGAALFLLAVIGVVSYACIQNFIDTTRGNENSRRVTVAIADILASSTDAETGMRGYFLTADDRFLEPYRAALAVNQARLEELEQLTASEPRQRAQFAAVRPVLHDHLALLAKAIEIRRGAAVDAAQTLAVTGQAKQLMDTIRGMLGGMRETEEAMQTLRSTEMAYSSRVTTFVITTGSLLAFALVGTSGWLIRRELVNKQRLDTDLREARRAAEHANESKSRFLANMSHEIRTPMAAIIGYADLVLDPHQTQSDRLDYINTIRRNGEHLLTIINDVLDLSKIEANKFHVDPSECCPCQVLSDVASLMRVRAVEKLIRFEVRNEGLVPARIRTDQARLRQILINLVGNAIKFTEEGWVRLIMRLEELPENQSRLRFDIIDTGIGMTKDQVTQLFQPFVQVDGSSTRRFGGTGLGLTISKRLAEMLGGRIDVDSSPGRGSTFTLTIDPGPLAGVQRLKNCREALAGASPNHPRDHAPIALNGRVLLVDDGHDNRQLLSVYLRNAGAEVTLAENGRLGCDAALAAAAEGEPFGVILMDMQMPELDGYGAAAKLRSKKYDGPIIALTAHAMAEDRAKCLNAGCTDYLSKPVRRNDLLAMVAKYLHGDSNLAGPFTGAGASAAAAGPLSPASGGGNSAGASFSNRVLPTRRPPGPGPWATAAPAPASAPLQSELTDEGLRPLLAAYLNELPERARELESLLAQGDLTQLSIKVHNLRGTGGLYGLMPLTDAAARVEELVHDNASVETIKSEVNALIALIRTVKGVGPAAAPVVEPAPGIHL